MEPSPKTGKVYLACTNNTDRGKPGKPGPDAPNPRANNKDGHVIELTEHRNRADATTFAWNILLLCGDPADPAVRTYFAGWDGPVSPISCPDNVAGDSTGDNLWVATDGQPSAITYADGLFLVPLTGRERGHVEQFLAVPRGVETTGPVIHDRDGSVFVAVQHPGEDGTWADQQSFFPDYVAAGERPRNGGVARSAAVGGPGDAQALTTALAAKVVTDCRPCASHLRTVTAFRIEAAWPSAESG